MREGGREGDRERQSKKHCQRERRSEKHGTHDEEEVRGHGGVEGGDGRARRVLVPQAELDLRVGVSAGRFFLRPRL